MQNSREEFKQALSSNFGALMNKDYSKDMMSDMGKFSKEMKEIKKNKVDREVAKEQIIKKVFKKGVTNNLITKNKIDKPIGKMFSISKKNMEEVDDKNSVITAKKEFASDLQDDPDFQEFKKRAKYNYRGVTDTYGVPNVSTSDPYIKKKTKYGRPGRGKEENNEATSSGSSGAYVGPLFGGEDEFIKKSEKETPKLKEGMVPTDGETTEATTSASSGSYESPAMWAKSTKKKDWGPSRKTQYPGGSFVKVKKKCTKFPYCNQGDINALKLTKNESVKEAIKNVSKKLNLSENVIKTILEYEYSKIKQ